MPRRRGEGDLARPDLKVLDAVDVEVLAAGDKTARLSEVGDDSHAATTLVGGLDDRGPSSPVTGATASPTRTGHHDRSAADGGVPI